MAKHISLEEWQRRLGGCQMAMDGVEMICAAIASRAIPEYFYKGRRERMEAAMGPFYAAMEGEKAYCIDRIMNGGGIEG